MKNTNKSKGFSVAIFSSLAVLLIAAAFALVSSSSSHSESARVFYESRKVAVEFDDAKSFFESALRDAAVDSDFASAPGFYGCGSSGDFCTVWKQNASAYFNSSLDLMNDSTVVSLNASGFYPDCRELSAGDPARDSAYNATYNVSASFVLSVNSSSARKQEPVYFDFLVDAYKQTDWSPAKTRVRLRNSAETTSFVYNITLPC